MSFTEYGETEKVCFSFSLRRRRAERGSRNFRTNVRLMRLLWEKVSREMQQSAYAHRGHIMTWDCVVLHVKTSKKSLPIFSRGFHFQKFPMKKKPWFKARLERQHSYRTAYRTTHWPVGAALIPGWSQRDSRRYDQTWSSLREVTIPWRQAGPPCV